jgi:hypothetical protein
MIHLNKVYRSVLCADRVKIMPYEFFTRSWDNEPMVSYIWLEHNVAGVLTVKDGETLVSHFEYYFGYGARPTKGYPFEYEDELKPAKRIREIEDDTEVEPRRHTLRRLPSKKSVTTGHCVVCGNDCSPRAKTCSPKCRKQLSRSK